MLTVGDRFPEFELMASSDAPLDQLNVDSAFKVISNKTYADKWKVIFFYPKDFTFVCPTEIVGFANLVSEFNQRNTQVLGCSVDSEFVHWAWRTHRRELNDLNFPLLSDIKHELSCAVGVLDINSGVSQRALFIVDPEETIRFVMVTDSSVGRNPNEVLRVLDALQTGELCQCGWIRGEKTINPQDSSV